MLRSLTVKNFAYFKETQTLTFDEGTYFLVGENDSGKTSLFEIIRCCMSTSKINHLTKPHDRERPSFAVCCFKNSNNEQKKTVSAIFRSYLKQTHDDIYIKCVYLHPTDSEEEMLDVEYLIAKETPSKDELDWQPFKIVPFEPEKFGKLHYPAKNVDVSDADIQSIIDYVLEYKQQEESNTNACETMLKSSIDKTMVITFPMRGILGCQWTEGKCSNHAEGQANAEEIITWHLRKLEEHPNEDEGIKPFISDYEKRMEKEYFRLITNNSDFYFSYEDGKLVIKNAACKESDSSMLTIPEGIYEAKKLAVLLAIERFQTVCLEEPDRGMHPQMIIRIRDLVLPQVKPGKVVLLITHNITFLNASTLAHVYLFKRQFDGRLCKSCITPLISENNNNNGENVDKTLRLITSGASPLLFYANKVLLVEGEDDFIFVSNLKQCLLTHDTMTEAHVESAKRLQTVQTFKVLGPHEFKQFLCSLHILPLGGEANKFRFNNFCKRIGLVTYFLMDEDALTRNIPGEKPNNDSPKGFLRLFGLDHDDATCQNVMKDVSILEEHKLFIWKGAIENAAASLAEEKSLKAFYKKNNVILEYNNLKAGKKTRTKIFSDKRLTNQNIRSVVEKIVEVSSGGESEFHRLTTFLLKMGYLQAQNNNSI